MQKRYRIRQTDRKKKSDQRFNIVTFFLVILFFIVAFRLADLCLFKRDHLLKLAKKQHDITIDLESKRGRILDRFGKEFATTVKSASVYAVPRMVSAEDHKELVAQVAQILGLERKSLEQKLSGRRGFVWLKRKVTESEAAKIKEINHLALGFESEFRRVYVHEKELAHVLGITNIDNIGLDGIELFYDSYLRGEAGKRVSKRDALGREISALQEKYIPARNGYDLVLNIDQFIQHALERELEKAFTTWHAEGACAIVMDPKTGRILALSNQPAFDPNQPGKYEKSAWRNRAITDFYEPGSVFKIVTLATALKHKKVAMDDTLFCENGRWNPLGRRIINDVHPYGNLTIEQVLIKSSNIGTVKIAQKLGDQMLYDSIKDFGFGELTGIDMPGEVVGIVHPLSKWTSWSITSVPYGQEVAATALQMLQAVAVIANGGNLVKPQIVQEIRDEYGVTIKKFDPIIKRRILDEGVAASVRQAMVKVVEEGTGQTAKIPGVKVAGKTGTSQKLNPGGGYSHSNFIGSFIGFAPADDPQLCMIVMIDDPRPMYYGGTVAAPVFQAVMKEALLYMEKLRSLPPEEAQNVTLQSLAAQPQTPQLPAAA